MRKTKIVCTLGPASSSEEVLRELVKSGMNVARLNFSHGTYDGFRTLINRIKKIRREMNVPLAIMLDTKGPEIRLKNFPGGPCELKEGQKFVLTGREIDGDSEGVSVSVPNLALSLKPGDTVLIDDGNVTLTVDKTEDLDVICTVVHGGVVKDHKGVNVPNVRIDMPFISPADRADLIFGIREDIDLVAASFVSRKEDVLELRELLESNGGRNIRIISKIENAAGVANFDEILDASDGIMVARGDMGVEIEFERIPGLQKTFIRKTCAAGKMSITATQMLESMIENTTPTRAEITDVANAVFDGTSAIMLSGETAVGRHPALVVKTMAGIALQAEHDAGIIYLRPQSGGRAAGDKPLLAICDAAVTMANDLHAKVIVVFTQSGFTARGLSSFRPSQPIIASTPEVKTYHQLALSWGVCPVLTYVQSYADALFDEAVECAKKSGLAVPGDMAVVTGGIPVGVAGGTNLVKLQLID